jgi:hypothetical protein
MPRHRGYLFALALATTSISTSALAEWKATGADVKTAMEDPRVAAVLAATNQIDRSLIDDDHAAFAALLADDLVVNNPQNTLSAHGATVQLNASGRISYTKYDRTIDYAGVRGGLVLVMGEELCVPKPPNPMAGQPVRRRFIDVWKNENGRWLLTARQATIIPPAK